MARPTAPREKQLFDQQQNALSLTMILLWLYIKIDLVGCCFILLLPQIDMATCLEFPFIESSIDESVSLTGEVFSHWRKTGGAQHGWTFLSHNGDNHAIMFSLSKQLYPIFPMWLKVGAACSHPLFLPICSVNMWGWSCHLYWTSLEKSHGIQPVVFSTCNLQKRQS